MTADASTFDPIFQDAAARNQLDPALLKAHALVESGFNPGAVNPDSGATGLMQMMPDTAKSLGIDPSDPRQSIYGAASLIRQNLNRYMGDVEKAVSAYHGGTDPSNWGPKTQAYVGKVADAFGAIKQNGGFVPAPATDAGTASDPIEAALSGKSAASQSADPIEAALSAPQSPSSQNASSGKAPGAGTPLADLNTTQIAEPTLGTPGRDFLNAAAQHLAKVPVGVAQLAANAFLPQSSADAVNQAVAGEEKAYQDQTPDSASSYAGATLGEIAPFALTGLGRGLKAIGDTVGALPEMIANKIPGIGNVIAPTAGKMTSAIAQGAIVGGSRPADTLAPGGSFWDQKAQDAGQGVVLGGAVQGAGSLLGAAGSIVKPLVSPGSVVSDWAQRVAGADAPQIAQILRTAPEYVSGSVPTTAQVWNNPDLALAEKTLVSNPATKGTWMARDAQNNAARWDALNGVAQDDAALKSAQDARQTAALGALDPSQQATNIEDFLRSQPAADAAPVLAKISMTMDSSLGQNPVIKGALSDIKSGIMQAADKDGYVRPDVLDGIRQNAGRTLAKYAPNGSASSQEVVALAPVKSAIENAITDVVPGFKDYLGAYADGSAPVNDMRLAQGVVDTLGSRALNVGGLPQITQAGLKSALRPSLQDRYGFSPQAQSVVDGLLQDLQRSTGGANSVRAAGSDTMTNALLPGWLGQALYGKNLAGGALNLPYLKPVGDFASKRVQSALADALLNPQTMANAIAPTTQPASARWIGPLAQALAARAPQLAGSFPLAQQLGASRP
ncbi:lytic transglycosylase domain-containing protein [Telmatospirillum sp.]|uniref:lytic transglycosylase domain-containing protein n=1 Tax=Telmatospirillum sp. TaxID=2079197 RepID=UPI00283B4D47|nr:lytic transglycosylase domain-containing protein [Telmatospirillum sp.]MDR3439886.1 lytic transglycosylase domain-containing protein [Telmatospirillum sp.]